MSTSATTTHDFPGESLYPKLFSPLMLRNQEIKNRIVFPPTCATWTENGVFADMATAYYEERAKHDEIGRAHV